MLLQVLLNFFQQHGNRTYWLAYSGGLDSHVLLQLCDKIRKDFPIQLRAIHINHHLNPQADAWQKHCELECKTRNIELIVHSVQLNWQVGESVEEVARQKRYAIFEKLLTADDILLTAHHENDQAETMLLQLVRGSGVKGLAAMPTIKKLGEGWHARPFLNIPRSVIQQYAIDQQIQFVEDDSNSRIDFTRNYMRHEILPILKKRWPTITTTLARSAAHCAESQTLLDELATEIFAKVQGARTNTLAVSKLKKLSAPKQRLVLRYWMAKLGFSLPNTKKLDAICNEVLNAAWDCMPCVAWKNRECRRYRDDLFLLSTTSTVPPSTVYQWDLKNSLPIPGLGILHTQSVRNSGLTPTIQTVGVRFRTGGEKVAMSYCGHRDLKKLLQEWDVLPWERGRIPLIFLDKKLIAVVGYFLDEEYLAKNGEIGYEFYWQRN